MRSSYVVKLFEEDWEKGPHWGFHTTNRTLEHAVAVGSSVKLYFRYPTMPLKARVLPVSNDPLAVRVMWSSGGNVSLTY